VGGLGGGGIEKGDFSFTATKKKHLSENNFFCAKGKNRNLVWSEINAREGTTKKKKRDKSNSSIEAGGAVETTKAHSL